MAGNLTAMIAAIFSGSAVSTDPYFNYTTLLLSTTATNGQQNNTFLDSSTNNFTITRNPATGPNAPTQGTFSPFSQTGWSNYFDGTDDRLSVPDDAKYYVGSSDFTIECLVYNTAWDVDDNMLFEKGRFTVGKEMRAYMDATSVVIALNVSGSATGAYTTITATTTNNLNTWYHLAFVRSGNTVYIFRDGTLLTSGSVTGTVFNSTEVMAIGGAADGNNNIMMNGYISNFRIITGQAVATSTFTPPTSPLTTSTTGWVVGGSAVALTGTVGLLTCQSNRFLDTSASPLSITVGAGTPTVVPFSPFNPTSAWSASTVGGSAYYDGTGDSLTIPTAQAGLGFGTEDFSTEFWAYRTNANSFILIFQLNTFNNGLYIRTESTTYNDSFYFVGQSYNWDPATNFKPNSWTHICVTRQSGTLRFFANGKLIVNATNTSNMGAATADIGASGYAGYLSGVRVVKGSVPSEYQTSITTVGTQVFTPPTAPPTNVTNTQLLLNFTNPGIYDATAKNVLETVGSAQVSTTTSKWPSTSMLFNGTTDYLQVNTASDLYNLSSGNWTIEAWVYRTGTNQMVPISYLDNAGTSVNGWAIEVNRTTGGTLYFATYNASSSPSTSVESLGNLVPLNVWTYIAVTCVGTTITLYVNGTSVKTGTRGTVGNNANCRLRIGGQNYATVRYWQGYIQDPRITKGVARTISTPTAAFPVQ